MKTPYELKRTEINNDIIDFKKSIKLLRKQNDLSPETVDELKDKLDKINEDVVELLKLHTLEFTAQFDIDLDWLKSDERTYEHSTLEVSLYDGNISLFFKDPIEINEGDEEETDVEQTTDYPEMDKGTK